MARVVNIDKDVIWINTDVNIKVPVVDEDTDLPQDLTGFALAFVLRSVSKAGTVVASKTSPTITTEQSVWGAAQTPAVDNDQAVIPINDTDTMTLTEGTYYWALWRTDAGNQAVLAAGTVMLAQAPAPAP